MKRFAGLASLTLVLACGDDGGGTDSDSSSSGDDTFPPICTPGVPVPCDCPDGSMGEAPCLGGVEVGACDCADPSTSSTTDPTTTSSSSSSTTDATDGTTTGSTTGDTETTGDVEPGCQNGVLEEDLGEQCDDGNMDDTDACSNECIASCGLEWIDVDTPTGAGMAAAVDSDGDYIVASALDDGTMQVAKFAPDGMEEWSNNFDVDGGGSESATPMAVATYGNNSIYIAGQLGEDNAPTAFVHHLDGDGNVATGTWPNLAGNAVGAAVATDPNTGNAVLVGWLTANNTAIRKLQPDGTGVWTIAPDFGGGEDDFGRGVAIDSAGNIWVGHDVDPEGDGTFITRVVRYPPEDGGGPPVANIAPVGPLVSGAGIPDNRTLRGLAIASDDTVVAAIATDPSVAANSWDFWVARVDNTGTQQSLTNSDDQNVMGSGRTVNGIALSSTDEISLAGTVDDGGQSVLVVRIDDDGSTPICNRATQDMNLAAGFTVGFPGAATAGTTVVPGGTATTGNPWLGRFRE